MLIIENINIRNEKKNAKSIATYDFSTLYTTLPHDKLRDCMLLILFLKVEIKYICISKIMLHTGEKTPQDNIAFSKSALKKSPKTSYTKLLFYGWKFTTQTENRYPNGN